jgi:ribosomal protein S18 acetylase RimI-like enzyme
MAHATEKSPGMMDKEICIRHCTIKDIGVIRELAELIWPATYRSILSEAQILYMMAWLYSQEALKGQMENDSHTFLLASLDRKPVGFASFSRLTEERAKLHKLYILPDIQGSGIGKKLVEEVIENALDRQFDSLELNVNRNNPAIRFYVKLGFHIIDEVDIAIGSGFYMNDYIMLKDLMLPGHRPET